LFFEEKDIKLKVINISRKNKFYSSWLAT